MAKKKDSIETRENLQRLTHVDQIYKEHFKRIHDQKYAEHYIELLRMFRVGEPENKIMRQVAMLAALDDINREFGSLGAKARKYEKQLEEIENDRKDEREREAFRKYNGD